MDTFVAEQDAPIDIVHVGRPSVYFRKSSKPDGSREDEPVAPIAIEEEGPSRLTSA